MSTPGRPVDVAVVGGGPAGLSAARVAAAAGLSVVVHERDAAIGEPVRTSGGSFIRPLRRLGIPPDCWWPVRRIRVVAPSTEVIRAYRRPVACVLDVRRTYQWLAQEAMAAGAGVRLKAHVDGPVLDGARVVGVRVRDPFLGLREEPARAVVDASGHTGVVARAAGLRRGAERSAVGVELEMYAPRYDQHEAVLVVGDDVAPGGYAWLFPCGSSRVRVGVGVLRPHSEGDPRVLLDRLLDRSPLLAGARATAGPLELHSGVMPLISPGAAGLVGDGVVAVGDAAGQGSALLGEGIRHAIIAGRAAGRAIVAARGDYSPAGLAAYPRDWQRRMGRDLAIAYAINTHVSAYSGDDWDRMVRRFDRLGAWQAGRLFAGHFTFGWALSVLATAPDVVLSVGRAAVRARRTPPSTGPRKR